MTDLSEAAVAVPVELRVNGADYRIDTEPRRTLADALREECEHGVCGACTVLLDGEPVRSCLLFAVQARGTEIRTVEGLADTDGTLHPLQEAFWRHHGLQCGFCTPGFLMLSTAVLEKSPDIGDDELREALSSNLCRCTGYQTIVEAVQSVRDAGGA